ncbi:MAG: TetR family transcriptional regulator [Candidatus Dormiibacterota bacterium]
MVSPERSPSQPPAGLRALKKARTRQAIAGVAIRLFAERGFDQVTVAEIAAVAEVSEKTVFNYFPTKGDLFFDESEEILADFVRTVGERSAGESVVSAVRRFMAAQRRRVVGHRPAEPSATFRALIEGSDALRAYRRAMFARFETELAAVLAADLRGGAESAAEPFVVAVALVGVLRARFEVPATAVDAGTAQRELGIRAERTLDLLEHGLSGYGRRDR